MRPSRVKAKLKRDTSELNVIYSKALADSQSTSSLEANPPGTE